MGNDISCDQSLTEVVRLHYVELCRFARALVRTRAAAEEVVQDALLSVWRRRMLWQQRLNLSAYLFAAVRNTAQNRLRRERVERRWQGSAVARGEDMLAQYTRRAAEPSEVDEAVEQLRSVIRQLPKRLQETIELRLRYGLSNAEIASAMGIRLSAVEKNIARGLRALRAGMRGEEDRVGARLRPCRAEEPH